MRFFTSKTSFVSCKVHELASVQQAECLTQTDNKFNLKIILKSREGKRSGLGKWLLGANPVPWLQLYFTGNHHHLRSVLIAFLATHVPSKIQKIASAEKKENTDW
jgi:hypothetical protein